jgi:hypothetical protein
MHKVYDPKGNELRLVLLQVVERDERGPKVLQVRHDDETVDLANATVDQRQFYMVWSPVEIGQGSFWVKDFVADFYVMKEAHENRDKEKREIEHNIESLRHDIEAVEAENKAKTEELRRLQKERDPAVLERLVAERTAAETTKTHAAEAALRVLREELSQARIKNKRLKDENEALRNKTAKR